MSHRTDSAIDRLARLLAGRRGHATAPQPSSPTEATSLDRATLVRTAAVGTLALSLGVLPRSARAAGAATTACRGGSLAACNASGWRTTQASIRFCDRLLGRPGGEAASYECYVDAMSARLAGMKDCRSKCPRKTKKQPKAPATPAPGGGGDGGAGQPPAGGPPPGCGAVDCVGGDSCCPVQGGGQICCAIGCARSGDGCCSSSSDC